uniref:Uncharacterized protein n=2 Tax=Hemiselmis andersenii TaxID=464988 RepID=A0A7S0Y3D2_HEMAN
MAESQSPLFWVYRASALIFVGIVVVAAVCDNSGGAHTRTIGLSEAATATSSAALGAARTATSQKALLDMKASPHSLVSTLAGNATAPAAAAPAAAPAAVAAAVAAKGEDKGKKADGGGDQGPNISQIWAVREWFVNIAALALVCGILGLLGICCVTQRGCYIHDTYLDKDKHQIIPEDEEIILPGDTSKV